ncbi:hypothetical protein CLOSTASPAR_00619 [[Clostridium] asparagiforme DSM 15981]|uniref:Uncharacterized protein n=1 Tax=[Clostridium] asparagiforme DSM 15981 TaxID=518636 RepID=C0CUT0_9FIRM|nr:hypothetical protein CLOSTASPAR_00619 [[Clostridium] asparagiforme DSM 15981]
MILLPIAVGSGRRAVSNRGGRFMYGLYYNLLSSQLSPTTL